MRAKRYIYSIFSSLWGQLVTILSGLILPRIFLRQFGSEVYGATTSITQFLGYIALLEGGIGGVARAALYKPLADQDDLEISRVVSYIQRFFRIIAMIFVVYATLLAFFYPIIAKYNSLDWVFLFFLVIVIAFSSLAQYYFGIAYTVLLQADQKRYFTELLNASALLINTLVSCVLVHFGVNMIGIRLAWCGVHLLRIGFLNLYIKRKYRLQKLKVQGDYLPEKWDGLGQHIAYFLHSHTDVIVLTIFVNLSEVSVYSIYNYIAISLNTLVLTLGANMEAVLGDMLARNEKSKLSDFFNYMEFLMNFAIIIGFSVAAGLIFPFVRLYTSGITDANYYRPVLGYLMLLSQMLYCIRMPYHYLTIAAGHFRTTKNAAFIEAGINISFSCLLGFLYGTEGIIFATVLSICYRTVYYAVYIERNILYRSIEEFVKRIFVTLFNIAINMIFFQLLIQFIGEMNSFGKWIPTACLFFVLAVINTAIVSKLFYKNECRMLIEKIKKFLKIDERVLDRSD